jgi:hypothetical protein
MYTLVLDERPSAILFSRMETIFVQLLALTEGQVGAGIASLQGCSVIETFSESVGPMY